VALCEVRVRKRRCPSSFRINDADRRALAAPTSLQFTSCQHIHPVNLQVGSILELRFQHHSASEASDLRSNGFTILSKHSPAPQASIGNRASAKTMPLRADTSVIIVGGGGTIGSSTALHLVRSGYTPSNITVLDTYPIPSAQSAGNDLNKVMGIRLRNKVDLHLSLEARQMWSEDDLFKEFFHRTGRVSLFQYDPGM